MSKLVLHHLGETMGKFSELDIEQREALFNEEWARVELLNRGEGIIRLEDLKELEKTLEEKLHRMKYYEETVSLEELEKYHTAVKFTVDTAEEPF